MQMLTTYHSKNKHSSPHESEGVCFYRSWFVCLSVTNSLSVTTITKKVVDGFVPNFIGRFLGGKERPSSLQSLEGCGSNGP